ncbi:hypothetical protein HPB50_015136 [Hyalomma asiaticum]|uniref:Uncharacterized protein n=1 Tax=Hyalomma asiaticum TaxID=266040 RepID=A0ACB7SJY3_HYAAI|nr:hypothetical protein HPB50_015136 [Hyalomma asiaticum]
MSRLTWVELRKGYLIKWNGYFKWHCTLEPNRHLNEACLREIEHPRKPLPRRLEPASEDRLHEVQKELSNSRRSSGLVRMNLDLDVFRWIFTDKGKRLEKGLISASSKFPCPFCRADPKKRVGSGARST